jgi:hypothetical protein
VAGKVGIGSPATDPKKPTIAARPGITVPRGRGSKVAGAFQWWRHVGVAGPFRLAPVDWPRPGPALDCRGAGRALLSLGRSLLGWWWRWLPMSPEGGRGGEERMRRRCGGTGEPRPVDDCRSTANGFGTVSTFLPPCTTRIISSRF